MSLNRPIWKLRDWIDKEKLDWNNLSLNKNAIDLLYENKRNRNWNNLSFNKNVFVNIDILKNRETINLINDNPDKINWYYLSFNKNAIEILEKKSR